MVARGERGATAVQYVLIAAGIAVVIVAVLALLGNNLVDLFTDADEGISGSGDQATDLCAGYSTPGNANDPSCDPASGIWTCPNAADSLILTGSVYSCQVGLDPCPARPLGVITVPRHRGGGSSSYTAELLSGVAGGEATSAVMGAGSAGSLSFTPAGSATWVYPAGRRTATITFTYDIPGTCANGAGRLTLSAR